MSVWEESTTWIAVGAAGLALLALALALVVAVRVGRVRPRREKRTAPAEDAVAGDPDGELRRARDDAARAHEEARRAREEHERARSELRWLRDLGEIGGTVDLEGVLARALETATRLGNAAAAMIVLAHDDEEPLVATFGLSPAESSRDLLGLPPEGGQARAVALAYRYTGVEEEQDEFRLRSGLAVPVTGAAGERAGTLALFWRRVERDVGDEELARLEALTSALGPALENAFRFEEARRLAELDPVTKLHSRRYLHGALARECARARRYDRRLSLVLTRLDAPLSNEVLARAGERLQAAVRGADVVSHLGDGLFAILLPESGLGDAERLCRRLRFAVGPKLRTNGRLRLPAGIVELRSDDDAVSLLARGESALARDEEPSAPETAVGRPS
ncbi:MAG TPA: diguanylate cyclase [Gaiellaceae bacterium]|nr:diguanylate cyclase [Gaiellaceae bacterium]